MTNQPTRRSFIHSLLGAGALACGASSLRFASADENAASLDTAAEKSRILKSLKWGMIQVEGNVLDRFQAAKQAGFDGIELDTPGGPPKAEVLTAIAETGIVVDGSVDSTHWRVRMTDADPEVRRQAHADLITALHDTAAWGGNSVLLVPGHGNDGTVDETWQRSSEQIQAALPIAARLGIHILIENVWNHMFYEHDGPADQTADQLAKYVDQFNSPWIGVQFDIGNHQKYGDPAAWIRTLGKRIVKLDVKDWGKEPGWSKIGDGDVDWPEVRAALAEIDFTGWAAAEVAGGGPERLKEIADRIDKHLIS